MKKIILSAIIATIGCFSMTAQDDATIKKDNSGYWGLRVGGDITCPGKLKVNNIGINAFNNGGGIEFGGIYNIPLSSHFYIEPGLKFYYDTYSFKKEWIELMQDDIILNSVSVKKFGVRVPLMAGFHFRTSKDVKFSIFTGPELELGLSGKTYYKGYNIEVSESIYGEDGDMNRVNVLWGLGAGLTCNHFYFEIKGGIGLANMIKDSYATFHENRVTIGVGYNF